MRYSRVLLTLLFLDDHLSYSIPVFIVDHQLELVVEILGLLGCYEDVGGGVAIVCIGIHGEFDFLSFEYCTVVELMVDDSSLLMPPIVLVHTGGSLNNAKNTSLLHIANI